MKNQFVREAKAKRISTQHFGYQGDPKPIYVDEQVTIDTFMLFKYAKQLNKIGCQYVWLANGRIMTRINSTARFARITHKQQVDEIEKELLLKKQQQSTDTNVPHAEPITTPAATVQQSADNNDKKKKKKTLKKNNSGETTQPPQKRRNNNNGQQPPASETEVEFTDAN